YTVDGRPIVAHLAEDPWASLVDEQRLGRVRPTMPVFVGQNRGDDVVSAAGTERMVAGWQALGADVTAHYQNIPSVLPGTMLGHVIGLSTQAPALRWLDARLR
ncbi:lipase family protein, partial [Gordonia sp. (in: high G+C Gram-positive bacteria)]|uniref:lipase family protein n=1 Tax=Gordonia sp. (in: high G+C Gram-positive bacteria) TaxID=84139 RepID=UPI0016B0136E